MNSWFCFLMSWTGHLTSISSVWLNNLWKFGVRFSLKHSKLKWGFKKAIKIYNWAAHHIFSRKTNHEFSRNYLRTSPLDDAYWQSAMEFKEMFLKRNEKTCFCLSIIYMCYGNMGCQVSKRGIQNWIYFFGRKSTYSKEQCQLLSRQKLDILLANKVV